MRHVQYKTVGLLLPHGSRDPIAKTEPEGSIASTAEARLSEWSPRTIRIR